MLNTVLIVAARGLTGELRILLSFLIMEQNKSGIDASVIIEIVELLANHIMDRYEKHLNDYMDKRFAEVEKRFEMLEKHIGMNLPDNNV